MHDHDLGLAHDLPKLLSRRRALAAVLTTGVGAVVAGCGGSSDGGTGATATTTDGTTSTTSSASTAEIPEETAGPYPGDGSNGPNVLTESGVVRRDITRSFGDALGVAEGIPLRVEMTMIDVAGGGGAVPAAAVYLWHCDREGRYTLYDQGVADENYLRGVQAGDGDGKVVFDTIFPGAYAGRWPHIHFEVYASLDTATSAGSKLRTSQLALPQDVCETAYATAGYEQSVQNLAQTSLDTDNVFSDGYASQLATVTGSVSDGFVAKLNVGV